MDMLSCARAASAIASCLCLGQRSALSTPCVGNGLPWCNMNDITVVLRYAASR